MKGFYTRAQERFNDLVEYYREPAYSKLLPDPLPADQQPPTLVLNLDETLIYSTWDYKHGWRIAKRPGVDYFLAYITQFFEVVIITTQPQMNAEPILMKLDPVGYVPLRFYRDATRYIDGKHVKDLTHLNRDLSQVIIMDSNPEAFSLQPENGVAVPPWTGDPSDRYLFDIIPFLQTIAETRPTDVRPILQAYSGKDIPATFAESERILLERYQQEWEEEQKKKSRGLSGLLLGASKSTGDEGPPTELPLQRHRRLRQETFMAQHEREDKAFRELAKQQMKQQMEQFKESKMTILDYMTKVRNS
ncbi:HAD-like domain-containing protein [Syncephalis plumigaleata]|nr:HAD-like domain-containing protein [Syncephalis plumigaleata]